MPFNKAQSILKKVLPGKVFDDVYNLACWGYNQYQKAIDVKYYYLPRKSIGETKKVTTLRVVLPYTMVGRRGLIATYDAIYDIETRGVKGCLVECGVAKGGCSALMALVSREFSGNRVSWLFDSFEGLPACTIEDGNPKIPKTDNKSADKLSEGFCLGTLEEVESLMFSTLRFDRNRTFLVKGWFQDTLPEYKSKVGDIAILRLDGDWYESTKCCLENLYDLVVDGGYVIIDDYDLVGCRKALNEFLNKRGEKTDMLLDGRGGGWFKKSGVVL
jgi:hypothetical protein